MLERAHLYTVAKQQVSLIQVGDQYDDKEINQNQHNGMCTILDSECSKGAVGFTITIFIMYVYTFWVKRVNQKIHAASLWISKIGHRFYFCLVIFRM